MIDYGKTIDNFFTEVDLYLVRRIVDTKEEMAGKKIAKTRCYWAKIMSVPRKYINENFDDIRMLPLDGLVRGNDKSPYLAVRRVLNAIRDLYSDSRHGWKHMEKQHHGEFLEAYKQWKYVSDDSVFKDVVFSFRSAASFAVRSKKRTR